MDESEPEWLLPQEIDDVPLSGFFGADGHFDEKLMAEYIHGEVNDALPVVSAFDLDGEPMVPPESHVRDHLARVLNLVDDDIQLLHPVAPNTVHVALGGWHEKCAFCDEIARYDSPLTFADGISRGAWLCPAHAVRHISILGDGAYYVMLPDEVPEGLRATVNCRLLQLGREPVFE